MNLKERVLAVIHKEKPDAVPWMGDLAYFRNYLEMSNQMPKEYAGEDGLLTQHRDYGVGFYLQGYFPMRTHYEGMDVIITQQGDDTITTIKTPLGNLEEVWRYLPSTYSSAPLKHQVTDWHDLKILRYVYEHTHFEPDYALAESRKARLGAEDGFVLCYTPKSPVMELIALRAGIMAFTYMCLDAQEEVDETLAVMEQKHDIGAQMAIDSPAEFIMIPENLSSEVIGRGYYKRYALPYQKKWTDAIRAAGKISFIHFDGTIKGLIPEVSRAGFDVLEALTPAPVGDITMWEMDALADEKVTLWGGMPGAYFDDSISDENFDAFVIDTLEKMKQKPRFVLGVADQVPPLARVDRIKRVSELVKQYGQW
jgi:hypothetical protein